MRGVHNLNAVKSVTRNVRACRWSVSPGLLSVCRSLPLLGSEINTRYMPTIGNGYLGATIYDDAIFLNGLFEGSGGELSILFLSLLPTSLVVQVEDIVRCVYMCVCYMHNASLIPERFFCNKWMEEI